MDLGGVLQPHAVALLVCRWSTLFRCDPPKPMTFSAPHHTRINIDRGSAKTLPYIRTGFASLEAAAQAHLRCAAMAADLLAGRGGLYPAKDTGEKHSF